jgi:hypothetical protein
MDTWFKQQKCKFTYIYSIKQKASILVEVILQIQNLFPNLWQIQNLQYRLSSDGRYVFHLNCSATLSLQY